MAKFSIGTVALNLDGTPQLSLRLSKGFPIFLCDDLRQLIKMCFQQMLQFEEILDPIFRRCATPFGEGRSRGIHGRTDFTGPCQGGGVVHDRDHHAHRLVAAGA